MSKTQESLAAKKRIMFIKGEDFNYLTYNILILLDSLRCHDQQKAFKDHHKIAYLIDLVSSPVLASILSRKGRLQTRLSMRDQHILATAYSNGASRQHFVARTINSLVTRGLVSVSQGQHQLDLDVWVNARELPSTFLSSELYDQERVNIELLKTISTQLRILNLKTFLTRFYGEQGVQVWHS